MLLEIIQISLLIIIVIGGFYLAFFKSYFQEKGKNIATKEDIEKITKQVETVKSQFYYSTQAKLNLKGEEHNALVDGYIKYNAWLNKLMSVSIKYKDINDLEYLDLARDSMKEFLTQYQFAKARIELFTRSEELLKVMQDIYVITLEVQNIYDFNLVDLGKIKNETDVIIKGTTPENKLIELSKMHDKQITLLAKLNNERLDKYEKILPLLAKLREATYNHLQGLLE